MARMMTHRMAQALKARAPLAQLAWIDHPSGEIRLWTGIGDLEYAGHTWTGAGVLGSVGPISYSRELSVQDVTLSLRGLKAEDTVRLSSDVRGRRAQTWLACLDDGQVVPDPMQTLDLVCDYQSYQISDDGQATVSIIAHTAFYTLQRAVNEVWSDQDQQLHFPGDTGMALIPELQTKELQWTP